MSLHLSLSRLYDRTMVENYCREHDLDETPPNELPDAVTNGPVTIVVDAYPWGKVFYAEHHLDDAGATWIERNDIRPALPPWIEDVRAMVDRPHCLGFHESDHVCDGGLNPETGKHEQACRWKTICIKVQKLSEDPSMVDRFLDQRTDAQLWRMVEDVPRTMRPKDGRRRGTGQALASPEMRAASADLARRIFARCCEIGGWPIATRRHLSRIGDAFLVEHGVDDEKVITSYMAMYRRRPRSWHGELKPEFETGTEQVLANFRIQRAAPTVTIEIFTLETEAFREALPGLRVDQVFERKAASFGDGGVAMMKTSIKSLTEAHLEAFAGTFVSIVESNSLTTFGMFAVDREKPGPGVGRSGKARNQFKDPSNYDERRVAFLEKLGAPKKK